MRKAAPRPPPAGRRAAADGGGRPESGAAIIPHLANAYCFGVLFGVLAPPYSLLRRFAAGTGGFLRLGAPRCGSRARPDALRRRVRFAGYCALVRPAVGPVAPNGRGAPKKASDQRERLPQFRAGARTGSGAVAAAACALGGILRVGFASGCRGASVPIAFFFARGYNVSKRVCSGAIWRKVQTPQGERWK